jgi:hypothetical protein
MIEDRKAKKRFLEQKGKRHLHGWVDAEFAARVAAEVERQRPDIQKLEKQWRKDMLTRELADR